MAHSQLTPQFSYFIDFIVSICFETASLNIGSQLDENNYFMLDLLFSQL